MNEAGLLVVALAETVALDLAEVAVAPTPPAAVVDEDELLEEVPLRAGRTPRGWLAPQVAPGAVGHVAFWQIACSWAPWAGMTVAAGAHL